MQTVKEQLIKALRALRRALDSAPERVSSGDIRCLYGQGFDKEKNPKAVAVKEAANNVRNLLRGGENNDSIPSGVPLQEILDFLDRDVDDLKSLPAGPLTQKKLATLIEGMGGAKATATNDKAAWCHSPDERKPDRFDYGPLTAMGKKLDAAIFRRTKPDAHYLQLKGSGADGRLWIIQRRRFCLEVWFDNQHSYTTAKQWLDDAAKAAEGGPRQDFTQAEVTPECHE